VGPIESDADNQTGPPIPVLGCRSVTLFVKSTAPARLDVLPFKPVWHFAPTVWFDRWEVGEGDIRLEADRLFRYHADGGLGIPSMPVTMEGEGRRGGGVGGVGVGAAVFTPNWGS